MGDSTTAASKAPRHVARRWLAWAGASALAVVLAGCGGGGAGNDSETSATAQAAPADGGREDAQAASAVSTLDATRLAQQASFGSNPALVADIRRLGTAGWIAAQMKLPASRYTLGKGDAIHKNTSDAGFCNLPQYKSDTCWRDWYTTDPLVWDFYRNAVGGEDQLRQRVAYALQQILVINNNQVTGTYGFRNYYNTLLGQAFGNYRTVLKKVTLSPLMGDFLNSVNNDRNAPNENYARELLQLFSIGTCQLRPDGSLKYGRCVPTYDNDMVRNYAYALTGWTYPAGGVSPWGCWPRGANCQYYGGDMTPLAHGHDTRARKLLGSAALDNGSTAEDALDVVLDSLIAHPNIAPFIGKQLIQQLVTSNPSGAYVQRVATVFRSGRYTAGGQTFGTGRRGDLAATVAAVLLDEEARDASPPRSAGKLREPALMFTGVLRALHGKTDGDALGWYWGETLREHLFRPPTVFNFYPPNFPLPGSSTLVGPAFGIHNANTALERLNFLTYLIMWGGSKPNANVPGAVGTQVDLTPWETYASEPATLVDRFSVLATGTKLPAAVRTEVIAAVTSFNPKNSNAWRSERVKQAALLVFASPSFQVQR